jgi:carboxypeptidase C (cathepsin A)
VPSIARGIYLRNKQVDKAEKLINLAGVAIGNGWIDAYVQVSSQHEFSKMQDVLLN